MSATGNSVSLPVSARRRGIAGRRESWSTQGTNTWRSSFLAVLIHPAVSLASARTPVFRICAWMLTLAPLQMTGQSALADAASDTATAAPIVAAQAGGESTPKVLAKPSAAQMPSEVAEVAAPAFARNGFLVTRKFFGLHIHRARTIPWPSVPFGTWRWWDTDGLGWRGIEPARGQWDFATPDYYLGLAEAAGVDVIWTLGGVTPQWASARPEEKCAYGMGCAAEPSSMADWATYVKVIANRYKGRIRYYEIWNEPHLAATYRPERDFYSGTAETMVEMTRVAYQSLKAVDPNAKILSPAPVADPVRIEKFYRLGGGAFVDIVSVHFYSLPVEDLPRYVGSIREMLAKYGQQEKELWNTEAGFLLGGTRSSFVSKPGGPFNNRLTDEEAAAAVARYQLLASSLRLSRSVLYAWDNDSMGLTASRGQRPSVVTRSLNSVTAWLLNSKVIGCGSTNHSLWICPLEKDGRKAWAVWTVDGPVSWRVPMTWNGAYVERLSGLTESIPTATPITVDYFPALVKSDDAPWGGDE